MNQYMYPGNLKRAASSLRKELREYEKAGTHLYLEGRPSRAEEIVRACCFAEESVYMRDFISNEQECITDINFVKIRECRGKSGS